MATEPKPHIFTYADFDIRALCRQASALRHGSYCTYDLTQRPVSGRFNWAIFITFEDQVRWVFKSPHARSSIPTGMGVKVLASEAATLRYIRAHSDIPVPEVHSASFENEIGVPFILMDKASGRPLSHFWRPRGYPQADREALGKAKVLSQLGGITWKLSQLRQDRIGSLFEENGTFYVKECLSRGNMLHDRDSLDVPLGPFSSALEFYDSLGLDLLERTKVLQPSSDCLTATKPIQKEFVSRMHGLKTNKLFRDFGTIGHEADVYSQVDYETTAHRGLRWAAKNPTEHKNTFPLGHPDPSTKNIYIDGDYNITCIIDWAFASTITDLMLFAAPGLPEQQDELGAELRAPFINGIVAAMPDSMDVGLVRQHRESLEREQALGRLSRLLSLGLYRLPYASWHCPIRVEL